MIRVSPLIDRLVEALQALPGVGPKWATRMALSVLQHNREGGGALATALADAVARVTRCSECRMLCEADVCAICVNPKRDGRLLCVVESPVDVIAIEQAGGYTGRYFVLHGRLSPIDGIGPAQLGLDEIAHRARERGAGLAMVGRFRRRACRQRDAHRCATGHPRQQSRLQHVLAPTDAHRVEPESAAARHQPPEPLAPRFDRAGRDRVPQQVQVRVGNARRRQRRMVAPVDDRVAQVRPERVQIAVYGRRRRTRAPIRSFGRR